MAVAETNQGKHLFTTHCANCHGMMGEGFLQLYPPIRNSRFLDQDIADLPCVVRYGLRGEIQVGNQVFNQNMPGNAKLSPAEIAQIIIYMQKSWEHHTTDLNVEKWLLNCHKE